MHPSTSSVSLDTARTQPHVASTIILLDSLSAFYTQEKIWVTRARAVLENELSREAEREMPPKETSRERGPVRSIKDLLQEQAIKREDDDSSYTSSVSPPESPRMRGRVTRSHLRARRGPAPDQILDMFGSMIHERAASCERITRLVRTANKREMYSLVAAR